MSTSAQSKLIRKISFQRILEQTKEEKEAEASLIASLPNYTTSSFDSDSWVLDKRSDKAHPDRIAFKEFKPMGKTGIHLAKLFAIIVLNRGTNNSIVNNLHKYFVFLSSQNMNLLQVDKKTFSHYSFWIEQQRKSDGEPLKEAYKHHLLDAALRFHQLMNRHSYISYIKGVEAIENPYNRKSSDSKYKVIDDQTLEVLDDHFSQNTTPLHFRVAYWIMRLYGTRPEDTVNYPLDCVKQLSDEIATIKHAIVKNSKSDKGIDYNIEFLNLKEPMQKMLFDLIITQQKNSNQLQDSSPQKGFLLTHLHPINHIAHVVSTQRLGQYLKKVQHKLLIPDSKRAVPRDFKKTAITMRAENGWTIPQLKHFANHRTYASLDSYSAPSEAFMIKEQRKVLMAENKLSDRYVFKGKIINGIDVIFEKKLSENPRAHKISNLGYCPDVSGCGNHFECLGCESLVPDKDLEEYYLEQADRYIKITEKQLEIGDKAKAKDSFRLSTLFASLYNKVTNTKKGGNDGKR